ncbi:ABC transporter permease [Lachnoclostridium pacaense]|uniref:ABC transporter permease n=1 Tax=Enterocloster hominis (ex Hitch et al. 2024) TaxID=1917870 RepID=UPI001D127B3F|nr:ABC transporter permease [Lachnoclostridium pacaense]MCC2875474.1 ABC transporter permease [Lachnoclostridium pacaense]
MNTFRTMLKTELKLSVRGMDMVIFGLCLPVVMVVIFGAVFGNRPAFEGASHTFLEQAFGALSAIAICAGGVMGLPLLISEYRQKKILKRFRVTPVSPALILAVHVVIYAIYALVSLILVYGTAAVFFGFRMQGPVPAFILSYLLVMLSMFSIGLVAGGLAPDTKTAGIIASILYFPMLLFSGATLPYEIMPGPMQRAAGLMPLTQGIKLLKAASLGQPLDQVWFPVLILGAVFVLCSGVALRFFRWE